MWWAARAPCCSDPTRRRPGGVWRAQPLWAMFAPMRDREPCAVRGGGVRYGMWSMLACSSIALTNACSDGANVTVDGGGTERDGPAAEMGAPAPGALVAPL